MDFDLSKKHNKEVEQRRKEAKRKLDQKRQEEDLQKRMEEGQREREEQRLEREREERKRADEEALMNDGIRLVQRLQPYPVARADDKLILPPSTLEFLEKQGALDGGVLTFTVALPSGPGGGRAASGVTQAGVAEFVAEEGTVGVPPRVALCLTKGAGLDSLAAVGTVEVRFARLPRSAKSKVKFQPRGEGFHVGGKDAMRMDLEHVLLESLRGHTALSQGDWLPIRHNGVTYELLVRELEPEPQLLLLDTDLTVEVLPSEQTEAELREEEERKAREEAEARAAEERERARLARAQEKALALPPEPATGPDAVQVLLRLPEGGRLQRRFLRDGPLQILLDWTESEPQANVRPGEFHVVQKWPGHTREFGTAEATQSLNTLGFGRQEALFLRRSGEESAEVEAAVGESSEQPNEQEKQPADLVEWWKQAPSTGPAPAASDRAAWNAAEERAHQMLDKRVDGEESPTNALRAQPTLDSVQGEDLVDVFNRLVAFGMPPQEAAAASKKYAPQLRELGTMGFENWPEAVKLLDKYQGRLLRVANALAEGDFADVQMPALSSDAPPVAPVAQPVAPAAPAAPKAAAGPKAVDTAAVKAKYEELLASGLDKKEAATQAVRIVKEEAAKKAAAAEPASTAAPMEVDQSGPSVDSGPIASYDEKLTELAAMGFTDVERNNALLRKYAGRVERVVDALCNG